MLTTKNIEAVAVVFNQLFARRRFTYTAVRPDLITQPGLERLSIADVNVYTGVRLLKKKDSPVTIQLNKDSAMLVIGTTEYLCMYDTQLTDVVVPYDYTHKNPYVMFDGDRVTIKYQTPCAQQKVDVFTIEHR